MLIDPEAFEAGFTAWVGSLMAGFEREVVAIDGKTVRRSFDRGREQSPLHLVSAWASEQGLVLDVTFREDDSRIRDPTAVRNFALLRKIALNLVGQDRTTQASLRAKRKRAAWDK